MFRPMKNPYRSVYEVLSPAACCNEYDRTKDCASDDHKQKQNKASIWWNFIVDRGWNIFTTVPSHIHIIYQYLSRISRKHLKLLQSNFAAVMCFGRPLLALYSAFPCVRFPDTLYCTLWMYELFEGFGGVLDMPRSYVSSRRHHV